MDPFGWYLSANPMVHLRFGWYFPWNSDVISGILRPIPWVFGCDDATGKLTSGRPCPDLTPHSRSYAPGAHGIGAGGEFSTQIY